MARPKHLPEAQLNEVVPDCLRCGYDLRGTVAPGPCPECGLAFDASYLVLCGTAMAGSDGMTPRRWAWVALAVIGAIYSQAIGVLFLFQPVIAISVGLGIGVWLFAMLLTKKGDRRGQERFVFGRRGIVCLPLHIGDVGGARSYVAWPPGAQVFMRRVSPVWYHVKVEWEGGRVFNAGVRCTDDVAENVRARLYELAAGAEA